MVTKYGLRHLMYFVGWQFANPPLPKGGSTVFDVFAPDEVNLFSSQFPSH